MKRIIATLLTAVIFISTSQHTEAQTNIWRILRGAYSAAEAYTMSEDDLAEYVAEQVKVMDRQSKVAPASDKYAKRLANLVRGLDKAEGRPLNFKVYITSECNAFACPDGSVRVYSGIMDLLNDNELLGVIGHEIGHVAMKHSYNAWKDAIYRGALDDVMAGMSSRYARLSDSLLGMLTGAAISAKYSKIQENEADDYGYKFLVKHNKNPWAMAMAFEKMKKLSGDSRYPQFQRWLNIFSSHPDFDTRISRMKTRAERDGYRRPK